MPAATRCFLALSVLLACGVSAVAVGHGSSADDGGHRSGSSATTTLADSLMDTSWGDEYIKPQH
ncbi:hypothetical protein OHS33_30995 [Streptomyces sp. NBC_00536]|uniref:hypothetical protein n=1 Tax=Streptomyces sp. NBC_00536 TaxID=2975769 RepID=UPI002E7FEAC6|nr:hypothetical protein [Streptomyces sp. NBC_00536]WUC82391.1 hypothetical protein OHS33_30995 [Streptomyces sp. NBC_00536]